MSAGTERAKTALISGSPLPPSVEVYFVWECMGGQDLENLVFLDNASPLVRRRVGEENVNTGLPIGEGVYASASAHFLQ